MQSENAAHPLDKKIDKYASKKTIIIVHKRKLVANVNKRIGLFIK